MRQESPSIQWAKSKLKCLLNDLYISEWRTSTVALHMVRGQYEISLAFLKLEDLKEMRSQWLILKPIDISDLFWMIGGWLFCGVRFSKVAQNSHLVLFNAHQMHLEKVRSSLIRHRRAERYYAVVARLYTAYRNTNHNNIAEDVDHFAGSQTL